MIEIRLHGRGGQGVKKASMILGRTGYMAGYKTQDFAMYGAERKGAPVTSFVRIDKKAINTRGHIFHPDYIVILDDTLDIPCNITGAKPTTQIIINSAKKFPNLKNVHVVDATSIVMKETGKNITNVAMLGALAKISKIFSIKNIENAVKVELGKYNPDMLAKNMKAAKEIYNQTK
ncbi:2-oxoacid:acceptor oxidoreductase family protein [Candidatus Woesearchaeota archaeon]|nr:2-oxoacid:acceptor oxidoreductase family protein [Candidatus Woesearchaeota archaeon]